MKLHAAPGTYLVSPLEEKSTLTITSEQKSRIVKGKVEDIGDILDSAYGGEIRPADSKDVNIGDTIYFLSYEGQYDQRVIDNKLYYFVNFPDLKGFEK